MARTMIKITQTTTVFAAKIELAEKTANTANPGNQPPKNRITIKALIAIMLQYSPKKNKANVIEEYSTLYPATNSDSASGRSKGTLLVSANNTTYVITTIGMRGKHNQVAKCW
jgi:hypothetical protein